METTVTEIPIRIAKLYEKAMRYASSGRGVTLETLTDGQRSGKSGRKTGNGHISTATAEVEPLEAWTPGPRWKGHAGR